MNVAAELAKNREIKRMLKIKYAKKTGGKAGKGHNKTSTIQIFDMDTNCIVKQFRYDMNSIISHQKAIKKAQEYLLWDEPIITRP